MENPLNLRNATRYHEMDVFPNSSLFFDYFYRFSDFFTNYFMTNTSLKKSVSFFLPITVCTTLHHIDEIPHTVFMALI